MHKTEKTLDEIAKLVCEDRQKEIERLRRRLDFIRSEAVEFADWVQLNTDNHDLFDFLVGI